MVSVVGPFASFIGSQGIGLTFGMVVASMVASADVLGADATGRPIVAGFERFHVDDQPPAGARG
ncbi:MAG: hypothetical protein QGG09_22515, partial [Pirellulaceae bacterium]|nr:hypothetical protein [Pirellulaceae bacterium]